MRLNRRSGTISSGDLRSRIECRQPTYTPDGRGGQTVTFSTYRTVWAKVTPRAGSRRLEEAQVTYNEANIFTLRVSEMPIQSDWIIRYNDKDFTIHGDIENIENRNQYWSILGYTKKL